MSRGRSVRSRSAAVALTSALVLALAGCNTVAVTSGDGVLTATSGTQTTLNWYFFNEDFKDFAAARVIPGGFPRAASEVYPDAIAAQPGIKYFKVRQIIDGFSEVAGSDATTTVLLKANEFANQGDGLKLSATENINLSPPAYGFDWLTGGSATRVTTVVPSDLCGLFVLVLSDDSNSETSDFYDDVVATTDTYDCSSSTPVSNQGRDEKPAGPPGIFLTVAGPVGRSASEAPIYYGADRVAVTSTYLLTVTRVSNVIPTITTLAEGTIDADGSFTSMTRLPALAPGTYNVQMVGTHVNGSTLQLTSQVTIGGLGQFTSIGANIPVIR
jgi:hypothetical protein